MKKQIEVKQILIALGVILIAFILFSGYTNYSYLEEHNKELSKKNEILQSNIDSLKSYNILLEHKLEKSVLQTNIYEKEIIKALGKLNQIKSDYQNEKKNPVFTTTNERYNFIRSEIGKQY